MAVNTIEHTFNETYNGELEIGKLDGFLPFKLNVTDIKLSYLPPDSDLSDSTKTQHKETVIALDSAAVGIEWAGLLRRKISINYLMLKHPYIKLKMLDENEYTIDRAVRKKIPDVEVTDTLTFLDRLRNFEILAPNVEIKNGRLSFELLADTTDFIDLPQSFVADSINLSSFVEITEEQRFVDIDYLDIKLPDLFIEHLQAVGQVYNNQRFLEFNGFQLNTALSQLNITGEIDGFNAYKGNWQNQILSSAYDLKLDSTVVYTSELADLFPKVPIYNQPFIVSADVDGDINSIRVNKLLMGFSRSFIDFQGDIVSPGKSDSLSYDLFVNDFFASREDFNLLLGREIKEHPFIELNKIAGRGNFNGTRRQIRGELLFINKYDSVSSKFAVDFRDSLTYSTNIKARNFNAGRYTSLYDSTTSLNFNLSYNGQGISKESAVGNLTLHIDSSRINNRPFKQFALNAMLDNGFIETDMELQNGNEFLTLSGWLEFLSQQPIVQLRGRGDNINLSKYFNYSQVPTTSIDFDYSLQSQGFNMDKIYGNAAFDVTRARVDGKEVMPHNFQVELNRPTLPTRSLQIKSSLLDLTIQGDFELQDIKPLARKWIAYSRRDIQQYLFLQDSLAAKYTSGVSATNPIDVSVNGSFKNMHLIHMYMPATPQITSSMQLDGSLFMDDQRLMGDIIFEGDSLGINNILFRKPKLVLETELVDESGKTNTLNMSNTIDEFQWQNRSISGIKLDASLSDGFLALRHTMDRVGKKIRTDLIINSTFEPGYIESRIESFYAGIDRYNWQNSEAPTVIYRGSNRVDFNNFELKNKDEKIRINGTFSNQIQDSLTLELTNIHLGGISDIVDWPFEFSGVIDGSVFTKTLFSQPVVAGNLLVNRLALDDRVVGDVNFNSAFNPEDERFNTLLTIITDSSKYSSYLEKNNGIGQKVFVDGYFYPPKEEVKRDKNYDFEVDIPQIDMWILPYIVQNVFESAEGVGSGRGSISGNFDDFDFNAAFNVDSVTVNTIFLNTNYKLEGGFTVDRFDGVDLDSIRVSGDKNGSGILYGNFDFNNFSEVKYFDLWLQLNDLPFMNIPFTRDDPFYGNASGSGLVHLTGSNEGPSLSTVRPILVNTKSKIGIPLLEEITVNENQNAISFVDNFDDLRQKVKDQTVKTISISKNGSDEADQEEQESRDFTEFFDLNLQFTAPESITGEIIFDPVTDEIITAQGTGSLQVILQDGDLSLFGNFEIQGGKYNFVSGDIIRRNFRLQQGGTIRWEGDPENARLDINAIYRARPDVSTIFNPNSNDRDVSDVLRIPVELNLEVTGTVESVENDFSFNVPNTIESAQGARVSDLETRLNRDDNKLLQAVSLLITGELVPVTLSSDADATSAFGSNFRNESGNVVLSPLLSSQISNLLNNNISNLDIDLNMAGFDQVDLGIALRLFNDRLILSREGQIGGAQNDIGNLGATYRLTQALSVIAFHRQDPTFGTLNSNDAGQSIQSLNGLGLEAQFDFNSWSGFSQSFKSSFRSVFGISKNKDEEEEQEPEDENLTSNEKKEEES